MREIRVTDHAEIAVGKPIGFSIYSADKTLLLGEGYIVPNDFVRQGLIRSGKFRSDDPNARPGGGTQPIEYSSEWQKLIAEYAQLSRRARTGFRMTSEDGRTEAATHVLGASEGGQFIMSGARGPAGAVEVHSDETWVFRAIYCQSALRFKARVAIVTSEPFRHFYLDTARDVEFSNLRKWPRAPVCLPASRVGDPHRLIVDLSVGGARIAVDSKSGLAKGQSIMLHWIFPLLGNDVSMSIDADVLNEYGRSDPRHSDIIFYGVKFTRTTQNEMLLMHAYVQEQLYLELDRVRQALIPPPLTTH